MSSQLIHRAPALHETTHAPGGTDDIFAQGGHTPTGAFEAYTRLLSNIAAQPLTAGTAIFVYFTAPAAKTVTQISAFCKVITNTPTLVRLGLYTVTTPSTGAGLTLVAQTADVKASVFTVANTIYTAAFDNSVATSYALVAGTRYAVGIICVGGTAAQLGGVGWNTSSLVTASPVLARASAGSLSDLPTPVASPATTTVMPWVAVS